MRVPFTDLSRENTALLPELLAATERVMRSGKLLYGSELEAFETELAAWMGAKHAVGVASGTDAVEISLRCVNATGGTVSVPAFTAIPCVNAVEAAGARPVLREEFHVVKATAHLDAPMFGARPREGGYADGPIVADIAHCLGVSEDVAGQYDAVAVSFYPTKNLGCCGDGGAVVTNRPGIAARARSLRHYGMDAEGVAHRGQNSRLNELQAAYLRAKLPHVREWNEKRQAIAGRYMHELKDRVDFACTTGVFHLFVIRHPERDRLRVDLLDRGIGTMIHYERAVHEHPRWTSLGYPGQFPVAEAMARTVLSLPCYPYLTDAEQDAVIAAVKECT